MVSSQGMKNSYVSHNNALRLATESTGISVTGNVVAVIILKSMMVINF